MSEISIIHPSRGRSQMAFETAKLWAANAHNPKEIQYILSLDIDEPSMYDYANNFSSINTIFGQYAIATSNNKNVVQAANAGAKYATGKVLVLISDDFSCEKDWDIFILKNIDTDKQEALCLNDGLQPVHNIIMTLPVLTQKLYKKLGWIYYHEYSGIRADDDLAHTCLAMDCLKINKSMIFQHNHWVNKKKQRDETNNRHDSPEGWKLGNRIFEQRKAVNFGV